MAGENPFGRSGGAAANPFGRHLRTQETSPLDAALSGAGDAITFGFGDELQGVFFGEEARDASRARQERARAEQPLAFGGGQIGGALLGGGIVGGGLRAGARLIAPRIASAAARMGPVSRIAAASGAGAAGGGAYAAGDANGGEADVLGGALFGAATGGVGQGVLGELLPRIGGAVARSASPEMRAANMVGRMQERYGQTPANLRQALADAPDNAVVGDVIPGGSSLIAGAGARPSAGRDALRDFYDARNNAMAGRGANAVDRHLLGGEPEDAVAALNRLEATQRADAGPLYARVHAGTVSSVPRPLRDFVAFHDRAGATFRQAVETTRETMRRTMGANATDEAMMSQPLFWHRLLENVQTEVGASIRGARINPLGAPRGSAVADMTQDARALNTQVRRLLGADFRRAQDIWAGSARSQEAIELGYEAVKPNLNSIELGQLQRRMARMTEGERAYVRLAAANRMKDMIANADTQTGRADALRAITRNAGQRRVLETLFGGSRGLDDLMRELDGQRALFQNSVEAGIGVNSHTADRLLAYQSQVAQTNPTAGGVKSAIVRMLTGDMADQYDEGVSNRILDVMRTPARDALAQIDNAGGVERWARGGGLLSRAARERARGREQRPRRLAQALTGGLYAPVGGEALVGYGGY